MKLNKLVLFVLSIAFLVGSAGVSNALFIEFKDIDFKDKDFSYESADKYKLKFKGYTKSVKWEFDIKDNNPKKFKWKYSIDGIKMDKIEGLFDDFTLTEVSKGTAYTFEASFNAAADAILSAALGGDPLSIAGSITRNSSLLLKGGATTNSAPVPEPATLLLLGTGLVGLAGFGRKKFFNKK